MGNNQRLLSKLKEYEGLVLGIGKNAFPRIIPAMFLSNYQIVCYKDSLDVELIKKEGISTSTIEGDLKPDKLNKVSYLNILKHPEVKRRLLKNPGTKVFIHNSRKEVDKLLKKYKASTIVPKACLREIYNDKEEFRSIAVKLGFNLISGETISVDRLDYNQFSRLKKKYSSKLVFQLTKASGGGKGTFFISTKNAFRGFQKYLKKESFKLINVTKFIEGPSAAITGCVTKHGVLCGIVQTQIMDQPKLMNKHSFGTFCGNDWLHCQYSKNIQKKAEKMCIKLGEYMKKNKYRGIFGLDLIIEKETGNIYPVECNSRYTGAFPIYSMLQIEAGEIPFDVFQLLEFLEIDYSINLDRVNRSLKTRKKGSHVLLKNPHDHWVEVEGNLAAGVYKMEKNSLKYLREGLFTWDIKNKNEFIFTDGCPRKGNLLKPGAECGRLIFKKAILNNESNLLPETVDIIKKMCKELKFKKVSRVLG